MKRKNIMKQQFKNFFILGSVLMNILITATQATDPSAPVITDNKPKILLVEDHAGQRKGNSARLVKVYGKLYDIETAVNFQDGIDKAQELQPKLIITDGQMGDTDAGIKLIEVLSSTIPIILYSGENEAYMERAMKAGAKDAINKEVQGTGNFSGLQVAIDRVLKEIES
jgi:CheY-like chemotaxis protein